MNAGGGGSKRGANAHEDAPLPRGDSPEREEHSTLRRYVEGLGGELEVVARVAGKVVRLRGV
jgi:hypothetical protein